MDRSCGGGNWGEFEIFENYPTIYNSDALTNFPHLEISLFPFRTLDCCRKPEKFRAGTNEIWDPRSCLQGLFKSVVFTVMHKPVSKRCNFPLFKISPDIHTRHPHSLRRFFLDAFACGATCKHGWQTLFPWGNLIFELSFVGFASWLAADRRVPFFSGKARFSVAELGLPRLRDLVGGKACCVVL